MTSQMILSQGMSMLPSPIITFPLPYKKKETVFRKGYNNGSLSLSSSSFVPYGLYGRYALLALTNLAVSASEKGSRVVRDLSLYKMLQPYKATHVQGRQLELFEQQMMAWSHTLITFSSVSELRRSFKNILLLEESSFFLKKNSDGSEEKASLVFNQEGQDFLIGNSVPIPHLAVMQIESAFDFDVFTWLVVSIFATRSKEVIFVPWAQLEKQFGINPEARNSAKFHKNFQDSLTAVRNTFDPEAKFTTTYDGVAVFNSPLLTRQKEDVVIPVLGSQEEVENDTEV